MSAFPLSTNPISVLNSARPSLISKVHHTNLHQTFLGFYVSQCRGSSNLHGFARFTAWRSARPSWNFKFYARPSSDVGFFISQTNLHQTFMSFSSEVSPATYHQTFIRCGISHSILPCLKANLRTTFVKLAWNLHEIFETIMEPPWTFILSCPFRCAPDLHETLISFKFRRTPPEDVNRFSSFTYRPSSNLHVFSPFTARRCARPSLRSDVYRVKIR